MVATGFRSSGHLNFSTSFQKINIGWPQQPLTEIVLLAMKNWIFDDSFLKKGLILDILVPGMIQPTQSVIFLMKWGCKGHLGCRCSKDWKITTSEWSRSLNSALFWCFEKTSPKGFSASKCDEGNQNLGNLLRIFLEFLWIFGNFLVIF